MKRYAVVKQDGIVDNIILWDEASTWTPPEGMSMIKVEDIICDIGWKHENGVFTNPAETAQPDQPAN